MASTSPLGRYIQQLVAIVDPTPSNGYKARLIVLLTLCAIQFALCLAYFVLIAKDSKAGGKKIWLWRMQRRGNGKIIVVNSVLLYVGFQTCEAIMLATSKARQYCTYITKTMLPHNLLLFQAVCWSMAIFSIIAYFFSNASAALQLRSRGKRLTAPSKAGNLGHNIALCSIPAIYIALIVPFLVLTTLSNNNAVDLAAALLPRLQAASVIVSSNPSAATPAAMQELTAALGAISAQSNIFVKYGRALLAIHVVIAGTVALLGLLTLPFVMMLRKQSQWHSSRRIQISTFEKAHEQHQGQACQSLHVGATKKPDKVGIASFGATTTTGQPQIAEDNALIRLAKDLSISTPVLMMMAIYFVIVGVRAYVMFDQLDVWPVLEFLMDAYAWVQLPYTCGILAFFIYNMLKNPDRYGTAPIDQSRSVGPLEPRHGWPTAVRVDFDVVQRIDKDEDLDLAGDSRTDLGSTVAPGG